MRKRNKVNFFKENKKLIISVLYKRFFEINKGM